MNIMFHLQSWDGKQKMEVHGKYQDMVELHVMQEKIQKHILNMRLHLEELIKYQVYLMKIIALI